MKTGDRKFQPRLGAIAAVLAGGMIAAAQAAPGDALGPPLNIVPESTTDLYQGAAIARDADGDIAVAWRGNFGIYAQLLQADGTPRGPAFVVDASTQIGLPDVAIDADGDIVVAWQRMATGALGVYVQRYGADGTPQGGAQQVSEPFDATLGKAVLNDPAVAMDADGDFVVAWSQGRAVGSEPFSCAYGLGLCVKIGGYSVRARRYTGGGATPQPVQTVDAAGAAEINLILPLNAGSTQDRVSVAMAPAGAYVVTWNRLGVGLSLLSGVYVRRYDAAGQGELKRLAAAQPNYQGFPAVAMASDGRYVVTYRHRLLDGSYGIYVRQYPAGTGFGGAAFRVDEGGDTTPTLGAGDPSVAMDTAGDFVVSWTSSGASGHQVRGQRYADGGGAMGMNFQVSTGSYPPVAFGSTDVAMDAAGNFAFAWDTSWQDSLFMPHSRIDVRLYDGP